MSSGGLRANEDRPMASTQTHSQCDEDSLPSVELTTFPLS